VIFSDYLSSFSSTQFSFPYVFFRAQYYFFYESINNLFSGSAEVD
jgi:hypothetical protein